MVAPKRTERVDEMTNRVGAECACLAHSVVTHDNELDVDHATA